MSSWLANIGSQAISILNECIDPSVFYAANLPYELGHHLIDQLILCSEAEGTYDGYIVMYTNNNWVKQTQVLDTMPSHLIAGRPGGSCPKELREKWRTYESSGLRSLGRKEICPTCKNYNDCSWCNQWKREIPRSKVVAVPLSWLMFLPNVIALIQQNMKAKRILTIVEDADFVTFSYRKSLELAQIRALTPLFDSFPDDDKNYAEIESYYDLCKNILNLTSETITTTSLQLPTLSSEALAALQTHNLKTGSRLCIPIYDISNFCESSMLLRTINDRDELEYYHRPSFPTATLVLGAYSSLSAIKRIVAKDVVDLTGKLHHLEPTATKFYNLAALNGTASYFTPKKRQVLDFFAQFIKAELYAGKKVVALTRSGTFRNEGFYTEICKTHLNKLYSDLGINIVAVLPDGYAVKPENNTQQVLPIITYSEACKIGAAGKYARYDTIVCLTGHYHNGYEFNRLFNESLPVGSHKKITIEFKDKKWRCAIVQNPETGEKLPCPEGQAFLGQVEGAKVLKAIGCICPQTSNCTVFTFQCGGLPDITYDQEYYGLPEAKKAHGSMPTAEVLRCEHDGDEIKRLRLQGKNQKQVAETLQISVRKVRNYWKVDLASINNNQSK